MSIFDKFFKLNVKNTKGSKDSKEFKEPLFQKEAAISVIMHSVNNKFTFQETERIYDIISSKAMSLSTDDARIREGMKIITELKEDWLTKEEKENFVAGVWLCECATDSMNNKGISYINSEELKYTRHAVLGSSFKALNETPIDL